VSLLDIAHQSAAQTLIQRAIRSNRVPHAYLFHGPDGIGKENFAIGLAELLLCSQPVEKTLEGEQAKLIGVESIRAGCGTCQDCHMLAAETHPDLHLIYRQLNRDHPDGDVRRRKALDLGIDVMRHFVIDRVGLTPNRARMKVFVIREADRATVQAQNALLKTLEEPPGDTVLILLVKSLDRLLPTTLSRCQLARFDALPTAFVREKLAALQSGLADEQITWYAANADGSIGQATEWADDNLYELNARLVEGLAQLASPAKDSKGRGGSKGDTNSHSMANAWIEEAKGLSDAYRKRDPDITDTEATRRALKSILHLAANWYADVLRHGSGENASIVNTAQTELLAHVTASIDLEHAAEAVNRIAQTERQLDLNVNTQLAVGTLISELTHLSRGQSVPMS